MRKVLVICTVVLTICSESAWGQDLVYVRQNYEKAANSKDTCAALIRGLRQKKNMQNSLALAYQGALETIWAKYTANPFAKLNRFEKGTSKIETAVRNSPDNLEIRYLRLSIQKHSPGFLGYKNHMKSDRAYLRKNRHKISSKTLQQRIDPLLKEE